MATVVLQGAKVIDGTGREPIEGGVLVIEGGKIAGVGVEGQVTVPQDAEVIDVTGKTVLPGLINCHTHIFWDAIHDIKEQTLTDSSYLQGLKTAMCLRQCLQAGVTTIRDMGTPTGLALAAAQAVEDKLVPGPRIFHCGTPLCITGGHTFWFSIEVDGEDEVRKAVREQIKYGATWIKLMASGSRQEGLTAKGTVWTTAFPEFTREELLTAVEEAHSAGRKVTAHTTIPEATLNCLKAGLDCIEHAQGIDDRCIELMVKNNVYLCPTFCVPYLQVERGREIGLPESAISKRRATIEKGNMGQMVAKAVEAGVKVVLGTDAGSPAVPHSEVVREMELMVELGACRSEMDAILAATKIPAEMLGMGDLIGTLEVGKEADVVVVNGDPLRDLAALREVVHVFVSGEQVVRDGVVL